MSILLTLASFLNLTNPLTSLLYRLANPLLSPLSQVRQAEVRLLALLAALPQTNRDNADLRRDNYLLKIQVKALSESLSGQTLAASVSQAGWQVQPVRLVSLGSTAVFTSSDFSHIKPGQPVVSDYSLLGLVQSVQPPIVKVLPLNHPQVKIAAQLETGTKGDYLYQNNHPYIVNLPSNVAFNSKTIVLTLPSEQLPENLVIGQVDKVTTNPANPTQEATLTLDQEISSAKDIYIITSP